MKGLRCLSSGNVYFSKYVNEDDIVVYPSQEDDVEEEQYRFKISIPFKNRDKHTGKIAVVLMKNPSKAGKSDENGRMKSDDTIYRVLDYYISTRIDFSR